jgi:hypothetical protein
MLSYVGFCARTMIGSCSAITTCGLPALLDAVGFTSGELGLFLRGFLETAVFVAEPPAATVDRVETFALIALMAGGGLDDGTGGVLVRAEARVAGADAFARPAMMVTTLVWIRGRHAFATRRAT